MGATGIGSCIRDIHKSIHVCLVRVRAHARQCACVCVI
jgi:hypothetical protein